MAKRATVVAGVLAPRLGCLRAPCATYHACDRPSREGTPVLPVTLAGLPLFSSEMYLPVDGDRPQDRLWFITIDDLEATYHLFDRHHGEVQQRLERASDLLVLLEDASEELLDDSLLVVGVVAELHHLLLQSVKTESKVINVLIWLEG
jgi:hypothetical protein